MNLYGPLIIPLCVFCLLSAKVFESLLYIIYELFRPKRSNPGDCPAALSMPCFRAVQWLHELAYHNRLILDN